MEEINNQKHKKKSENTSGKGKNSVVPKIVSNKFNWGAFFLTWIWGCFNKVFISLLIFPIIIIPFILSLLSKSETINISLLILCLILVLAFSIYLGVKGNTLAWQNKRFSGIRHFHEVQKNWAIAGSILYCIQLIFVVINLILIFSLTFLAGNTMKEQYRAGIKKAISTLEQASELSYAIDGPYKGKLTTERLVNFYSKRLNVKSVTNNTIEVYGGMLFTFEGDGYCYQGGNCTVKVDVNGINKPNKQGEDIYILRIEKDNNGQINVNKEDKEKLTNNY